MAVKQHPSLRAHVWDLCEPDEQASALERRLHAGILWLILLNVLAIVLESVPAFGAKHRRLFDMFEYFSVAVFTVEYLARLWSCPEDSRYRGSIKGRLQYMFTPMALIDLVSILPTYLFFFGADLRVIRAFRLMRLLRVGKIGRYSEAAGILIRVLRDKREEMVVTLSLVGILAVIFASLVFYAESSVQPEHFPDIPHALWWAFVTITTVGYGDIAPVTPLGKVIGICTAILGILMIALPTGVLGAAFVEEINRTRGKSTRISCPHCGGHLPRG